MKLSGKKETLILIRLENERTVITHSLFFVLSGNIHFVLRIPCSRTAHCLNLLSKSFFRSNKILFHINIINQFCHLSVSSKFYVDEKSLFD